MSGGSIGPDAHQERVLAIERRGRSLVRHHLKNAVLDVRSARKALGAVDREEAREYAVFHRAVADEIGM